MWGECDIFGTFGLLVKKLIQSQVHSIYNKYKTSTNKISNIHFTYMHIAMKTLQLKAN